jgi:hypothetical protein
MVVRYPIAHPHRLFPQENAKDPTHHLATELKISKLATGSFISILCTMSTIYLHKGDVFLLSTERLQTLQANILELRIAIGKYVTIDNASIA